MSSKEVKCNNFRTWNDVQVQLARNPPPHVIQVVSAPIATQMASRRVYPRTGIDVEDNAVVNNVVEVLYEVVSGTQTGRTLTYATSSLLPVLLLLFLEKLEGHFDQFYPKPKLLEPHGQHPRFVVAEIWADRDM